MRKDDVFRIVHHDPREVRSEQDRILAQLRKTTGFGSATAIGSTAVDGLIGKGDLDFALSVRAEEFDQVREQLDKAFTRDQGQLSNDEFQGYHLPSRYDASLQLFVSGSEYDMFDRFCELLRNDEHLRNAYNELKRTWDGRPMEAYRSAKGEFIEKALLTGEGA
jgi:GrpB-like predicted nucleotidyltransferase (UPF0157 family)